jgi:hypothetical protein
MGRNEEILKMCIKNCGVALSVLGLAATIGVFAVQGSASSDLPATSGMVLATSRGAETTAPAKAADAPAVINMNDWQETAIRRGSIRRV